MFICINCGQINPIDSDNNKLCPKCGLLAIKIDNKPTLVR